MQERLRDQLGRHPRLVAGSAVAAIVLVAGGVGLAIGVFDARLTGDASPFPSVSANPSASPSSEGSPSSTLAAQNPNPAANGPLLQVRVDGLRMRATASTSADIVRSLDRGEVVRVMSGPVEADGYAEPALHVHEVDRQLLSSYLFWLEPPNDAPPPPDADAPSVTGAAWPFDGPIEQFGEPVGQERCGYLDLGQAFGTLRLMRELGVPTHAFADPPPRQLSLDGVGVGSFATDAGWYYFWLTPRSPDGYPSCAD